MRFVRLALKFVMQNDGDFVDAILLYHIFCTLNFLFRVISYTSLSTFLVSLCIIHGTFKSFSFSYSAFVCFPKKDARWQLFSVLD